MGVEGVGEMIIVKSLGRETSKVKESQRVLPSRLASGVPLQRSSIYFIENVGFYYLLQLKYAGKLVLFKKTVT